jgi:glutathione synthase/RimK-type ligase-like ATP-grasp enzyme
LKVAFLTCERFAPFYLDDRAAVAALSERGVAVAPVLWDGTTPQALSRFDAVVVRSVWDWYERRPEFRRFLGSLSEVTCPVFNAPSVLQEFADKRYLVRLAAAGVPVVPTLVLEALAEVPLALATQRWDEVVLKPAFTANAADAQHFARAEVEAACARSPRLPPGEAWLLQKFMPEVTAGELSFVFFGGEFSHAAQKKPKAGDWRVQEAWGGGSARFEPSAELVGQARAMLLAAVPDTLYARVDGVVVDGRLLLMELEAVEPELFFRYDSRAAGRFADALQARLKK